MTKFQLNMNCAMPVDCVAQRPRRSLRLCNACGLHYAKTLAAKKTDSSINQQPTHQQDVAV
ncbi:hypothetical protein V8B55DRAFT_1441086 [Mucor lusitanicus]